MPTKCVFEVADPSCCDEEHIVAELMLLVSGMLLEEPKRGAENASLLSVIDSPLQALAGHPFPVLDLAKNEGATVFSYNIDLTGGSSEVSFQYLVPRLSQVTACSIFALEANLPGIHRVASSAELLCKLFGVYCPRNEQTLV